MLPALTDPKAFPLARHLHHVQAVATKAVVEVKALLRTHGSAHANTDTGNIGVFVCDANIAGTEACASLILPFVDLLHDGCRLVLTLKLRRRTGSLGVSKRYQVRVS